MSLIEFLGKTNQISLRGGPSDQVVLSSRVRLARNLKNYPFPGWARKSDRIKSYNTIRGAVEALPQMKDSFSSSMESLTAWEKQLLVERHLISREHAAKAAGSGLVLNHGETICVMINEEDHLRMQVLFSGFQIKEAWMLIDEIDSELEGSLDYAFSSQLGYLTACPTNVGTGIRVSAMLHLPGLVLSEQINQIIQAVNKLGLAVRGLYGEGTEALGNIFQISNQRTLGESEKNIIERLTKVLAQLIEHEDNARQTLIEKQPKMLYNHVGRAYGILANAYSISSKETINLLSLMRLGMDIGQFSDVTRPLVNELLLISQPAHLQSLYKDKLTTEERDGLRADLLRDRLAKVGRPKPKSPPAVT